MTIATTNPATGVVVQRFDPIPEAEIDRRIGLAARDFEVLRRVGFAQPRRPADGRGSHRRLSRPALPPGADCRGPAP